MNVWLKKIESKGPKLLYVHAESIPWSNYYLNSVVTLKPGGQKKFFRPWENCQGLKKGKKDMFSLLIKDVR